MKKRWVIIVGGGYGAFFFQGTEEEAERARADKAGWERAVARKRPAAPEEGEGRVSNCWNHPLFPNGSKDLHYHCGCGTCGK